MIVGVSGTFCSGKTTLVKELLQKFPNAQTFEEPARKCPYPIKGENNQKAQLWIIKHAIKLNHKPYENMLILDTTIYDNLAYLVQTLPSNQTRQIKELAHTNTHYDIIFNLNPLRVVDDGYRHTNSELQEKIHQQIRKELEVYAGNLYFVKPQKLQERVKFVQEKIQKIQENPITA